LTKLLAHIRINAILSKAKEVCMRRFIGRKAELEQLKQLVKHQESDLVVIRGRRRIGKSRLVEEFALDKFFLPFMGLAPSEKTTAQNQRDEFASQLAAHFNLPPLSFTDWNDAFRHLSHHIKLVKSAKPIVILFDEISWMGSKDADFIPKLKNWWDRVGMSSEKHPRVILILCGSISTWIEENIINSTAFFGRISLQFELTELSLSEANQFLKAKGVKNSTMEIFKMLSLTGGVPWYLERIEPSITADENIKQLCFNPNGTFVGEYNRIFHDLFHDKGVMYKKIIDILGKSMCDLSEIRVDLMYSHSGTLSQYLNHLITAGFVSKHGRWSFKTEKTGKQSLYRLSDNYLRFYLKYIEPNLAKIQANTYQEINLNQLPGWETVMGLQVENLMLNNRNALIRALGLVASDIVADNPYVQKPTTKIKGCQIDYLIQTRLKTLYVCEFKFRKKALGNEIIESVQEKIDRLSIPKGFGVVPVLVHSGGVQDSVEEQGYFYRIIDIESFL
jgi:uncharacterized protein